MVFQFYYRYSRLDYNPCDIERGQTRNEINLDPVDPWVDQFQSLNLIRRDGLVTLRPFYQI